jgi:hypothetical protein
MANVTLLEGREWPATAIDFATTDFKSFPCLTVIASTAEALRIPEKDWKPDTDKLADFFKFLLPVDAACATVRRLLFVLPFSWPTSEEPTDGSVRECAIDAILLILNTQTPP